MSEAVVIGERLRNIRRQQGLSLHDVEERSDGVLNASVVGSYERGERQVNVPRLMQLAEFYRVPITELVPDPISVPATRSEATGKAIIDIAALDQSADQYPELVNYVKSIQQRRGDYNGQIITMRMSDIETLAATLGRDANDLRTELSNAGVIR